MKGLAIPRHAVNPRNYMSPEQLKRFVYFSPFTKGVAGRPIKINLDLIYPFMSLVDPNTHEGQAVIRRIEQLRATAGQLSSMQNTNSAFDHMMLIGNLRIHYRIYQANNGQPTTVYITDIKAAHGTKDQVSGLYQIVYDPWSKRPKTNKVAGNALTSEAIYMNGLEETLALASKSAIANCSAAKSINLFYTSAPVVNDLGIWKSNYHSHHTREAKSRLAEIINNKKNLSEKRDWCVAGEGAALLEEAIRSVPATLSNCIFRFIDPVVNTPRLLGALAEKKARFSLTGAVTYTGRHASLIALLSHEKALYERVGQVLKSMALDEQIVELDFWQKTKLSTINKPDASKPGLNTDFLGLLKKAGVMAK